MNNLYNEHFNSLKKDNQKDPRKWKDVPHSKIGKINIVKMITKPKSFCRFSTIPIKIPIPFFTEIGKNSKIHVDQEKTLLL